jgi:hypothetical protein
VEGGEEEAVEGEGWDGDLMGLKVSWLYSSLSAVARRDYKEGLHGHERTIDNFLSAVLSIWLQQRVYTWNGPPIHLIMAKMPHNPHGGSAPDLPRPLLVRSNSLRQVAAARYLKLFSSPRR